MRRTLATMTILGVVAVVATLVATEVRGTRTTGADPGVRLGIGTPATAEEIKLADTDVRPDGHGLPHDSGTVAEGEAVYKAQCVSCHGPTGTEGPFDRLVGRVPGDSFSFGRDPEHAGPRTIGSYWPYATTVYDFINRAMPQTAPGSLSPGQVYSVVAYLLYKNQIIPATAVMNERTLPAVVMPSQHRFVADDRLTSRRVR